MAHTDTGDTTRRDFLNVASSAFLAVGAGAVAWPLIDQMNPDASVLAVASIEVDVSSLNAGESVKVMWRGSPVFIRRRTAKEIKEARTVVLDDLPDQLARNANLPEGTLATDIYRSAAFLQKEAPSALTPPSTPENGSSEGTADEAASQSSGGISEEWIVLIGVCTHLGCIPIGQRGDFGGWYCPCHGSHYDTAGRIRKGPAPENLPVPPYSFASSGVIKIG